MRIKIVFLFCLSFALVSFTEDPKPAGRTFNLVYVDNGKYTGSSSLSSEMVDLLTNKLQEMQKDKNADLLYFLSNSANPEHTRSVSEALNMSNRLYNTYYIQANSIMDKRLLQQRIFNENLSNIGALNLYFFVTESYLKNDLMGSNAGMMLNFIPRELQLLSKCPEENINIYIYYPKNAQTLDQKALDGFQNFGSNVQGFESKIKFHFLSI
jgi:hypothetical protein